MQKENNHCQPEWKRNLYEIIFKADTYYGKLFDELLLVLILISVGVVMLESIAEVRVSYGNYLLAAEWILTILFLAEYIVRIICSPEPRKYVVSFFGVVDLLAILPTFMALLVPGVHPLIVVRALRLLRVYRILKLYHFIHEGNILLIALRNSLHKIFIFMAFILVLVLLLGSIMYVVEGADNGFNSIPLSIYWAVITLTTVGYGDIVPSTDLGKFISTFIMLLGYSIIAIPTGIVSAEITKRRGTEIKTRICSNCEESEHQADAKYCMTCGKELI
ncbi:MAG: ion transporter [Tenuifilaceae bacterium]|jgi:voltage-gated potassium channel|nr:ion transporter [Tenuifilaceae bacterium]